MAEQMKLCTCCKKERGVSEYSKDKSAKDGLRHNCKICDKERVEKKTEKKKAEKRKEREKENAARTKKCNGCEKVKGFSEYCKVKKGKYGYHSICKKCIGDRLRERRANDQPYNIKRRIVTRFGEYLREKNISIINYEMFVSVGCTAEFLSAWIEYNLSLDKIQGKYDIDHLRPLSSFNCKTFEEVIECGCNHWENLAPKTPLANKTKKDRPPTPEELATQARRIEEYKQLMNI